MGWLEQPLFTADLHDDGQPGTFDFGFIDSSKFKGQLSYIPADLSQGYWGTQVTNFQIDGKPTGSAIQPMFTILGKPSLPPSSQFPPCPSGGPPGATAWSFSFVTHSH